MELVAQEGEEIGVVMSKEEFRVLSACFLSSYEEGVGKKVRMYPEYFSKITLEKWEDMHTDEVKDILDEIK